MEARIDRLFARWCRRGDARALGQLFDLAAPRLLGLSIHVCGDAAEAEDLVQATFLALIEQRTRLDPARPALPWLCGVLAHKAREAHRKAGRALDAERLIARIEADPAAALEERELDGALAAALDRLDEPYRAVLVLRLRHGMAAADIAHALGRSPGTVRVQLHRGAEKLRSILPASLLGASILALLTLRGLVAVRTEILRAAVAKGAAAGAPFLLGSAIVGNKVVVVAGVLVAALALVFWIQDSRPAGSEGTPAPFSARSIAEEPAHEAAAPAAAVEDLRSELAAGRVLDSAQRVVEQPAVLRGRVIDGEGRTPLAGVRVRLFAPRTSAVADLLRTRGELFEVQTDGAIRTLSHGDWPYVEPLSSFERLRGDEVLVYDEPRSADVALAETISDAQGAFSLGCSEQGGVIVCELGGFDPRCRAVPDPAREHEIALRKPWTLVGRVIDVNGKPPGHPLRLVFHAIPGRPADHPEGEPVPAGRMEGLGSWFTLAEPSGEFSLEVAAERVFATTPEPGYLITNEGVNPQHGGRWNFWSQFTRETSIEDVILVVRGGPCLRVFDASTREPIERVRLLGREQEYPRVRWSGSFFAPAGVLRLFGAADTLEARQGESTYFQVWADGYAATGLSIADLASIEIVDVGLDPGSVPHLLGRVLRNREPATGAEVGLLGVGRWWREEHDCLVDAELAGERGEFDLEAPEGEWILRIVHEGKTYFERVTLPCAEPLVIDLALTASIEVELVDAQGTARAQHVIALHGKDGRQMRTHSGADGRAYFEGLAPGAYDLLVPSVTTEDSFAVDEVVEIDLARGERELVRINVPALIAQRQLRICVAGTDNYSDWRARYVQEGWTALGFDGTVPMQITNEAFSLEIAAPDERRWELRVPHDAPDGTVLELEAGSMRYRGVVLDASSGAPLAAIRVHAYPWSEGAECADVGTSVLTDGQGRFEIGGLCARAHLLSFHDRPDRSSSYEYDSRWANVRFEPAVPASADPVPLELRLSRRSETVHVRGRVVRGSDGAAGAGARVSFRCEIPATGGKLLLGWNESSVYTDPEGRFEIVLPRTPQRVVRVSPRDAERPALELVLEDSGLAEEPLLELILP